MPFFESAQVVNSINWTQSDRGQGDTVLLDSGQVKSSYIYSSGTGVGQVNTVWSVTGYVDVDATVIIDLFSLNRSIFGGTINTSLSGGKLKTLIIKNLNTGLNQTALFTVLTTSSLRSPFNNQNTQLIIQPDGSFSLNNKFGYPIGTGSRYFSLADGNSNGINYEMAILGVKP